MANPKNPRYIDVSMAFRAHPVTGDVTKLVDDAAVKASIINLIFTMNYEVPFHPEIGSQVYASLFENITPITALVLKRSIEDVINNFEKRVILDYVDILIDQDGNGYHSHIVYRIVNRPEPVKISVFLERRR